MPVLLTLPAPGKEREEKQGDCGTPQRMSIAMSLCMRGPLRGRPLELRADSYSLAATGTRTLYAIKKRIKDKYLCPSPLIAFHILANSFDGEATTELSFSLARSLKGPCRQKASLVDSKDCLVKITLTPLITQTSLK